MALLLAGEQSKQEAIKPVACSEPGQGAEGEYSERDFKKLLFEAEAKAAAKKTRDGRLGGGVS